MLSEIIKNSVADWQMRMREGSLTVEEMREALQQIREERGTAVAAAAAKPVKTPRAKAAKQIVDADALLASFDDLLTDTGSP